MPPALFSGLPRPPQDRGRHCVLRPTLPGALTLDLRSEEAAESQTTRSSLPLAAPEASCWPRPMASPGASQGPSGFHPQLPRPQSITPLLCSVSTNPASGRLSSPAPIVRCHGVVAPGGEHPPPLPAGGTVSGTWGFPAWGCSAGVAANPRARVLSAYGMRLGSLGQPGQGLGDGLA